MLKATTPEPRAGGAGQKERPALADFYAAAGRFICVEADSAETALLFRRYFEGWHVSALDGAPAGAGPDATVVVRSGGAPAAPPGLERFETAGGGLCHTDGGTYFFESDGSAVRVRAETPRRVEVWVGTSPASRERAALARLVFDASMTALRRCGLFELHGAGLVEPGAGAGVLVVGPSGSGKSTLATRLASAGWLYLSDDSLLLSARADAVEARALRRQFAVTEPTIAAGVLEGFEDLLTEPAPFDPLKRRFEPARVFPDRFAEACVPRAVLFPAVTREASSAARRLSQAETMRGLIRMCPWACYDRASAPAHLGLLAALARQAAGYELRAGLDLFNDAGRASALVGALARGEAS
ncbi:MAG TPA: hypothetical protein VF668_10235 [Pyrinomonadaceae bacterium]|jgi:hypothetical protein